MTGPFISLSAFLLFGSFGLAVLVLLLLAWFGARLKVRALQTQMSRLRHNRDTLQTQLEYVILKSINQNAQKASPLVPNADADIRQLSFDDFAGPSVQNASWQKRRDTRRTAKS
jgi:hypothetical protein